MTQEIDFLQQLDGQISALDTQLNALNFEFLSALNSTDGTANGKTAVEIAATVIDKARLAVADRAALDQRRALIAQIVTANFTPSDLSEREATAKQIAERARALVMEAQNLESQAKSGRVRAEQLRTNAIDQLRRLGMSNDELNRIHEQIQRAKSSR